MHINVLISKNIISFYQFYPFFIWNDFLYQDHIKIQFFERISNKLFDCDSLFIDSRFFTPFWRDKRYKEAFSILDVFRKKISRVCWFDVTDSTGTTQFQVMPYIDQYYKKQILKNKKLYCQRFYNARIYTDYYHTNFNITNDNPFSVEPIKEKDLYKIKISWHLGMGPTHMNPQINYKLRYLPIFFKYLLTNIYKEKFYSYSNRHISFCFRGSHSYNDATLSFQRSEIIKKVNKIINTRPIRYKKYLEELRKSKIGISPFGAGEICFRDFEIISNGSMLLKPDMSHLETWPNIFIPYATYVPFKWDLSDFDKVLCECIEYKSLTKRISFEAQNIHKKRFAENNYILFLDRLKNNC